MIAASASARPSGAKAALPFAGICCLGLIGFSVAATIVLALIPLYNQKKDVTPSTNDNSFFLQYSADADIDSSVTGTVQNPAEVARSLGIDGLVDISSGQAQAGFVRRKRFILNGRTKRTLKTHFLFKCKAPKKSRCFNSKCLAILMIKVQLKIKTVGILGSIAFRILSGGSIKSYSFRLAFIGALSSQPIGFAGEATSSIFVAIKSGAFNNPLTWAGGIVPYGIFSVVIPIGVVVTLARSVFELRMKTCDVFGSLALGSGSSTFTFNYPPNIIIRKGGILQDLTSSNRILIPAGSLVTLHPGGAVSSSATILQTFSISGGAVQLGSSVSLPPLGPFTCGILLSGLLLSYLKVTFIAGQSGGFTSGSTFLGGLAPTSDICDLVGGCGVSVPAGVTLSTSDLNGELNMNIDTITVASSSSLELGTPGSTGGFRFRFPLQLNIMGTLASVSLGNTIFIPAGSGFNFFLGGGFTSIVSAFLQVVDSKTGVNIGLRIGLGLSFSGPKFYTISITGTVSISDTGPGGTPITSTTGSTPTSENPPATIVMG